MRRNTVQIDAFIVDFEQIIYYILFQCVSANFEDSICFSKKVLHGCLLVAQSWP